MGIFIQETIYCNFHDKRFRKKDFGLKRLPIVAKVIYNLFLIFIENNAIFN